MSTLKTSNLQHASAASANITLASDGTTTIAAPSNIIKSGTAVASTSGTSIDFTGLPSWVKRITVMFAGMSTSGFSNPLIQLGDSGGIETTGYLGNGGYLASAAAIGISSWTAGFGLSQSGQWNTSQIVSGFATIVLINSSSNLWACTARVALEGGTSVFFTAGQKPLSATLDRVRITTVNGTDTFDAGTINILYEG